MKIMLDIYPSVYYNRYMNNITQYDGGEATVIHKLSCTRCGHNWYPRSEKLPVHCPKCKSPYWDRPRKSEAAYVAEKQEG